MKQKKEGLWEPKTRLDRLGLPFLDVVLAERFLLPPRLLTRMGEKSPETIGDIQALTGMTHAEVCGVISECLELDRSVWLEVGDLDTAASMEGTVILDMRPDVSYESEALHPSAKLFHLHNPAVFLPFLRTCARVIVLSHSDAHAWSAAVSLRKMSVESFIPRKSPHDL